MQNRLSKINVRQLAENMSERTSNGQKLDRDALASRLWKQTRRCVLCEKPSYVFGLFFPSDESDPVIRSGLGQSQSRTIAYGLCVKCDQVEDAAERVEEKIAESFLEEANLRAQLDAAGVPHSSESAEDGTRWIALTPRA